MSENVGRLLRRLMAEAPDGPMTISELSRRVDKPRSTIHRHLSGYPISNRTIGEYAVALANIPEDVARITQELMRTAGHATPADDTRDDEIAALVIALKGFEKEDLKIIWDAIGIIRRCRRLANIQS